MIGKSILFAIIVEAVLLVGMFFMTENLSIIAEQTTVEQATDERLITQSTIASAASVNSAYLDNETTQILPANALNGALNAVGKIELDNMQEVILKVDGEVQQLAVREGDSVSAGDLLLVLDTTDLERALARAEIDLETARVELSKLANTSNAAEVSLAAANLSSAQANLTKVMAGSTQEQRAAAQSSVTAAWAKYSDLTAGPSGAAVNQAHAALLKADVDRKEAQRAYDQIKWRNDKGMTQESAALHKATIEYERVQAAYNEASQPSSQADIQSAYSSAQKAQDELNLLELKPTPAEIAEAQAKVAQAEAEVAKYQDRSNLADQKSVELKVKKALINLDEAQSKLNAAHVTAPITGTVLDLKVKERERVTAGKIALTIGNVNELKLTINVAEVDISQVHTGQQADITLNALRGDSFTGTVDYIAPLSKSSQNNIVDYPVTIRLTAADLSSIRPGMTAVATLERQDASTDTWLVPTNALTQKSGQTVVTVVRDGSPVAIYVTTGGSQGEWTSVRSTELRQGDEVVGSVVSFVEQQAEEMFSY